MIPFFRTLLWPSSKTHSAFWKRVAVKMSSKEGRDRREECKLGEKQEGWVPKVCLDSFLAFHGGSSDLLWEGGAERGCKEASRLLRPSLEGTSRKGEDHTGHKETPTTTASPFYCTQYLFISLSFSNRFICLFNSIHCYRGTCQGFVKTRERCMHFHQTRRGEGGRERVK